MKPLLWLLLLSMGALDASRVWEATPSELKLELALALVLGLGLGLGLWSVPKLMPFGSLLIPATKDQERQTVQGPGRACSVYTLRRLTTQKFRTRNGTELQLELCLLLWLPLSSLLFSVSAVFASAICTPCCGISLLYVILLQRFFLFFALCFSSLSYLSFSLSPSDIFFGATELTLGWWGEVAREALWENPIDLITVFLSQIIEFFLLQATSAACPVLHATSF